MPDPEDALARAARHVREGEERVARQAALVGRVAALGLDPAGAGEILEGLRVALELSRERLLRLERRGPRGRPIALRPDADLLAAARVEARRDSRTPADLVEVAPKRHLGRTGTDGPVPGRSAPREPDDAGGNAGSVPGRRP